MNYYFYFNDKNRIISNTNIYECKFCGETMLNSYMFYNTQLIYDIISIPNIIFCVDTMNLNHNTVMSRISHFTYERTNGITTYIILTVNRTQFVVESI